MWDLWDYGLKSHGREPWQYLPFPSAFRDDLILLFQPLLWIKIECSWQGLCNFSME
jgi:hypothetical protein